jgi:hypothetical protein
MKDDRSFRKQQVVGSTPTTGSRNTRAVLLSGSTSGSSTAFVCSSCRPPQQDRFESFDSLAHRGERRVGIASGHTPTAMAEDGTDHGFARACFG